MSTGTGPAAGDGGTRPMPHSGMPASTGALGRASALTRRGAWDLGPDDAETIVARARTALFVMVGVLAVIWAIQIANWADHYQLSLDYGIRPRDIADLPDILTAPFLHFSWAHIEGNSGPLFIFGFLAAYRGVSKFIGVTVVVVLTSGLAAWLTESAGTVGAGASGVVFGYFGYIMVRGFFDRHAIDMLIGAVMALCFAYQFTVLLPHAGIGWQAHVGGLVGGIVAGWVFRDRRALAHKGETIPVGPAAR
ncbi:MAG TPA: rhomboid family intramembrane serine protease [Streptosporangiaceae bacterium]|nr:rhomboid family intramembrane serine protease [Streptosporangiaceae bacterium]